jgi:molybdopterin-guanine dinucleotide biosynthesis protein B
MREIAPVDREGGLAMARPPILQVVGYKNSGKTTLICKLIGELREQGYRVGVVKHDAHEFEIDHEGRDTWHHYEAGADAVAITSGGKSALIWRSESALDELAAAMQGVDVVLAEGFKSAPYPKIVLLRNEGDLELLDRVTGTIAVAAWFPFRHPAYSSFAIGDAAGMTAVLMNRLREVPGL